MSVSVERKGNEATLKVTLPVEDVAKAFEKAVAKINKQVTIPGFRKGKAPRRVLEMHVGKDAIKEEAFEIAANSEYRETLKENQWVPVSDPEIKDSKFEEGQPMEMTLVVTLRPEPELGQYKDLDVVKDEKEITDADVDKEVENLQKRASKMVEAPEGKALEKVTWPSSTLPAPLTAKLSKAAKARAILWKWAATASSPALKISWLA